MCYARERVCPLCLNDSEGIISLVRCHRPVYCKPETITYYFTYKPCINCCTKYESNWTPANWSSNQIKNFVKLAEMPFKVKTITQRMRRLKHRPKPFMVIKNYLCIN